MGIHTRWVTNLRILGLSGRPRDLLHLCPSASTFWVGVAILALSSLGRPRWVLTLDGIAAAVLITQLMLVRRAMRSEAYLDPVVFLRHVAYRANRRDRRSPVPARNYKKAALFSAASLVAGFGQFIPGPLHGLVQPITQFGFLLFGVRARYYMQPTFDAVSTADVRRPILLLRPFSSDESVGNSPFKLARIFGGGTLEQLLAQDFLSDGPFITVDRPNREQIIGAYPSETGGF